VAGEDVARSSVHEEQVAWLPQAVVVDGFRAVAVVRQLPEAL